MLVILRRLPLAALLLGSVGLAPALAASPAAPTSATGSAAAWADAARDVSPMTPAEADRAFAASPAGEAPAKTDVRVDESALRYYAAQHATARVDAEIRRLRALYPGWEPPADLYRPAADEQALWDLFAADRLDQLKLEIERRAARQPGWRPSQDLVEKLRRKELRTELVKASDAEDWEKVQKLAEADPMLVGPADLDVTWRIAEAAARSGARDRALDLYRLALTGAETPEERTGTLRKALAVLGVEAAGPLLAEERKGPDGKGEFEALRVDVSRAALGGWLKSAATDPLPQADFDRLSKTATSADDEALLGWIEHRRKNWAAAERHFDEAARRGAGAKAVLGGVLVREATGRHDEAETLAATALDDTEVAGLFLDLVASDLTRPNPGTVPAERVGRFAALAEKLESGDAAQALGWYAHGARQYPAAAAWFAKAMAWRPSAKSAEGHLLALKALGDRADFDRLDTDYRGRFPDLPRLAFAEPTRHVTSTRAPKRDCTTVIGMNVAARNAGDALAAGWCLMDLKRAEEAAIAFAAARRESKFAAEAAYGESLAYLRSGRTDDAARAAAGAPLSAARRDEIGRVVLAQQAIAHFDRSDWRAALDTLDRRRAHAAEPRDLMTMRAWSLYHLGRRTEAFDLFTLLDRQLSTRESRAGLAATGPLAYGRS